MMMNRLQKKHKKILIAEDERDIRDLIEFTLTFAGHQVFKEAWVPRPVLPGVSNWSKTSDLAKSVDSLSAVDKLE